MENKIKTMHDFEEFATGRLNNHLAEIKYPL